MNKEDITVIIDRYKDKKGSLIALLEEIQKAQGFLPEDTLRLVADKTGHSLVDVYGVATFYKAFTLKPRGKHLVLVCLGTACHVRGAPKIIGEFENQLGIKAGETTFDKEFTVETVNCLGACALGPTVVADGHYFSRVNRARVKEIIAKTRAGLET
ncbi:MAG: NAD(P)H-dependent oxidoreductase subunit E, partial [Spirochaetaceae bacterium]